jgi:hypothetical protein
MIKRLTTKYSAGSRTGSYTREKIKTTKKNMTGIAEKN